MKYLRYNIDTEATR